MKISDCLKTVYQMAMVPEMDDKKYTAFEKTALKEFEQLYKIVVELELEDCISDEGTDDE